MYSIVLMMAMTSGGDVADFGHRHGGCCGGESYSACSGGSYGYSSCSGGSYSGCCGGGHHRHHRHHRGGCCGGYGGYSGCCGGYSGYSSCCGGGYAGYVGGAGCVGGHEVIVDNGHEHHEIRHEEKKADKKHEEEIKKPGAKEEIKKPEAMIPAPATIIVSLPANATLTIDDAATTSTASPRVFTSPVLPAGKDFRYTLKAQFVRAGQPVVLSREVTVRAGEETRVNLQAGLVGVASR